MFWLLQYQMDGAHLRTFDSANFNIRYLGYGLGFWSQREIGRWVPCIRFHIHRSFGSFLPSLPKGYPRDKGEAALRLHGGHLRSFVLGSLDPNFHDRK